MNREEELTDILQKIDRGQMDIAVAFDRILRLFSVINSVCPFCNSKETEENEPTRHCRYCNQDYG